LADKDKEIYCNACYGKTFGPKGYGYAGGSAFLTSGGKAGAGDGKTSGGASSGGGGGKFCSECGTGGQTGKFCSSCGAAVDGGGGGGGSSAVEKSTPPVSVSKAKNVYSGGGAKATSGIGGSNEKCAKCGKSVYANEKATGAGKTYHDTCFRCTMCKKGLSSVNMADKDGDIYCNACYGKNFGPKGYGYAGGGASVMATT